MAILILGKRDLIKYGITIRNPGMDLKVAAISAIPVLTISAALILVFFHWHTLGGALLVSAVEVIVLFVLGKLLVNVRGSEGEGQNKSMAPMLLLIPALALPTIGDLAGTAVFLFVVVGPVEELIFQGYIQSRLNEAFGRPP